MPKSKITIIDNTSNGYTISRVRTVYIPGPSNPSDETKNFKQVFCSNIYDSSETSLVQNARYYGWETDCLSYKLAYYLINRYGFNVVYEGIKDNTSVPSTSWDNLVYCDYNIDFITTGQYGGVDSNAAACAEKRKDCTYIADHTEQVLDEYGYTLTTTKPVDWGAAETFYTKSSGEGDYTIVEKVEEGEPIPTWTTNTYYYPLVIEDEQQQETTIYQLTTAKPEEWNTTYFYYYTYSYSGDGYDPVSFTQSGEEVSPQWEAGKYYRRVSGEESYVDVVRTQFTDALGGGNDYAAGFTPWFKSNIVDKNQTGNKFISDYIPASFGYLFAYANSIKSNPFWFASAGPERGVIPELISPAYNYNRLDVEKLQARASTGAVELDASGDNVGIAINPITNIRPFGVIVYGNRTLHKNTYGADGTGELKASSFLNIRNLVSLIVRTANQASERFKFDQNSSLLWSKFTSVLTPVLEEAVAGSGIIGYRLTQEPTTKKARLKAKLIIIPIEAVEDLELTIELADTLEVSVNE